MSCLSWCDELAGATCSPAPTHHPSLPLPPAGALAAGNPALHCPHAAERSANNVCGSACDAYCNRALSSCTGSQAIYADRATCDRACATFPAGTTGDNSGNSLACRYFHAGLSSSDPALHCPHAAAISTQCGTECDAYCNTIMSHCKGNDAQFADTAACKSACAKMPDGSVGATTGNSVNCRQYHADVAGLQDPALHCPHAGPSGGGVCVETCDSFCADAMTNCKGANELFASDGECLGACAGFPNNSTKAKSGNSRQCRAYHGATSSPARLALPLLLTTHPSPFLQRVPSRRATPRFTARTPNRLQQYAPTWTPRTSRTSSAKPTATICSLTVGASLPTAPRACPHAPHTPTATPTHSAATAASADCVRLRPPPPLQMIDPATTHHPHSHRLVPFTSYA